MIFSLIPACSYLFNLFQPLPKAVVKHPQCCAHTIESRAPGVCCLSWLQLRSFLIYGQSVKTACRVSVVVSPKALHVLPHDSNHNMQ